jgi:hypothetical protein
LYFLEKGDFGVLSPSFFGDFFTELPTAKSLYFLTVEVGEISLLPPVCCLYKPLSWYFFLGDMELSVSPVTYLSIELIVVVTVLKASFLFGDRTPGDFSVDYF